MSRRRKWAFRLLAVTVVPSLFFLLVEAGLRLGGFGYPTGFFVDANQPDTVWTNPRFGWRFFPPAVSRRPVPTAMSASKPDGTYRIFVLGGSAAQGVPDTPKAFGRILELMLRHRYPGTRFEVVNAAVTAVNSHVARVIALDSADYEPDLFIVYMGNNEVIGPYGPGTSLTHFSSNQTLIKTGLWAKSTKTGQLIAKATSLVSQGRDQAKVWEGMEAFLDQSVRPDDPRLQSVYEHFRANLLDICQTGRSAGAQTILCTVAVNLKDCAPFASVHRQDVNEQDLERWQTIYDLGVGLEGEGRLNDAIEQLRRAADIDEQYADLHYHLARCLYRMGQYEQAKQHYITACDLDALRFRTDSRLNQIIREVAADQADRGVHLVDVENTFAQSEKTLQGIVGRELLYEHVHLTFDGNYELAAAVFRQVCALIDQKDGRENFKAVSVPTRDEIADALPLTDWDRHRAWHQLSIMVSRAPFLDQLDHDRQIAEWNRQRRILESVLTPAVMAKSARLYALALAERPDDIELNDRMARLQYERGRYGESVKHWQMVIGRVPNDAEAQQELASTLVMAGRYDGARKALERAMRTAPQMSHQMHNDFGNALNAKGKHTQAIEHYRKALRLYPDFAVAHYNLGDALERINHTEEAVEHYRRGVALDPDFYDAHRAMAHLLLGRGQLDQAVEHFRHVIRLRPDHAGGHSNLGVVLAMQGQMDEAIGQFRHALQIRPRDTGAWDNLAKALIKSGRADEAIPHLRHLLQVDPKSVPSLQQLAWILATHPDASVRDADDAVWHAERAAGLTQGRDPTVLDTLAAAYAEAGQFDEAAETARKALRLAQKSNSPRAADIQRRLAIYEKRRPYRHGSLSTATPGH